ncbi:39S ribosomal protein L32, mitochondrial [Liparis tanakae]|uniref:39S ribosomal protein L32, mitochondrial n=1 Tax=Liparis tanakae TaxID=230148 RepID=A0A4Z2EGC0_9TELE|nr:39S ribosomal protein L32, mitochondrial [Liparis tanakae]
MMNIAALVQSLRCSLLHIERKLLQAAGLPLERHLAPALAVSGPGLRPQLDREEELEEQRDGLLWMANNMEPCLECGHLKQKHTMCGFCYAKVSKETGRIRQQMKAMEGGPLGAPMVETVVLYEGETPSELDKDKRIVERARKRPAWFS